MLDYLEERAVRRTAFAICFTISLAIVKGIELIANLSFSNEVIMCSTFFGSMVVFILLRIKLTKGKIPRNALYKDIFSLSLLALFACSYFLYEDQLLTQLGYEKNRSSRYILSACLIVPASLVYFLVENKLFNEDQ